MTDAVEAFLTANAFTRIPYRVYTDPDLYGAEQRGLFRGPVWSFVGLELEVPKTGDYKTNFIGDTPVVMVRADDGINVLVNRCAHRGNLVCFKNSGNAQHMACVYHNWSFDLKGNLRAVAFKNGVKGQGGMSPEFRALRTFCQRSAVGRSDSAKLNSSTRNFPFCFSGPWHPRQLPSRKARCRSGIAAAAA